MIKGAFYIAIIAYPILYLISIIEEYLRNYT